MENIFWRNQIFHLQKKSEVVSSLFWSLLYIFYTKRYNFLFSKNLIPLKAFRRLYSSQLENRQLSLNLLPLGNLFLLYSELLLKKGAVFPFRTLIIQSLAACEIILVECYIRLFNCICHLDILLNL